MQCTRNQYSTRIPSPIQAFACEENNHASSERRNKGSEEGSNKGGEVVVLPTDQETEILRAFWSDHHHGKACKTSETFAQNGNK
jgi:hypothetical protein